MRVTEPHFDSDMPPNTRVPALVDYAHTPAAKDLNDIEPADSNWVCRWSFGCGLLRGAPKKESITPSRTANGVTLSRIVSEMNANESTPPKDANNVTCQGS